MMRALDGIRFADFSHVMAGPYATHLLRLLGAEVIKIESPEGGDAMRYYGADRRYDGMAPAFIAVNAGKKSVVLDLKEPRDLDRARRLIERSDVLIENFRPGVIERLGLDYAAVKPLKPDIVYCSVSGYGQSGPRGDWPAIDNIVRATSGMMSLGGDPDGPPTRRVSGRRYADGADRGARHSRRAVPPRAERGGRVSRRCDVRRDGRVHDVRRRAVSRDRSRGGDRRAHRGCPALENDVRPAIARL